MRIEYLKKKNILHITPHLGGGVGSVLLNYLAFVQKDKSQVHSVATLDYANENSLQKSQETGFVLFSDMHKDVSGLLRLIIDADIVLIHFWNHPLLYDFLVRNELPVSRTIFWSHISGFTAPNVFTDKVLQYPDRFVFTTPLSKDAKEVVALKDKSHLRTVWSTGGVEHIKDIQPKAHQGFNIGYIGTVDYSKMHPDFIKICAKIDIPEAKFIVCGAGNYSAIQKQAQELGVLDKIEFKGQVADIKEYLEIFDVFGYPLNPSHYGTCDQVLQEAMASGVVPVVLDNPMENYMLQEGNIGVVAKNEQEYVCAIKKLYKEPQLRQELANKAKEYAISKYCVENLAKEWDEIFDEVMQLPKTAKKWNIANEEVTAKDVFIESLGHFGEFFESESAENNKKFKELVKLPNWQSNTKGTPHQYCNFFKDDQGLAKISRLMKEF